MPRNSYRFEPTTRETSFGTINEALQLLVYFDGEEVDKYVNYMGAFTTTYTPIKDLSLKLILSSFQTIESETYDILGQYWIGQLETDQGSDAFGEVLETKGVGSYLDHARNYLDATVSSIEHRGTFTGASSTTMWGIKFQHEIIADRLNEWNLNDSAGFTLPTHLGIPGQPGNQSEIELQEVVKTRIDLSSNRFSGFLQKSKLGTRKPHRKMGIDSQGAAGTIGISTGNSSSAPVVLFSISRNGNWISSSGFLPGCIINRLSIVNYVTRKAK